MKTGNPREAPICCSQTEVQDGLYRTRAEGVKEARGRFEEGVEEGSMETQMRRVPETRSSGDEANEGGCARTPSAQNQVTFQTAEKRKAYARRTTNP